ncbi:hypothetical protein [Streptomyces sp. NBC_01304]|uniref:hypothetical protein n=1 Tax=Streptomyces sp. NBC_01304 TaxID=2903818 RepID=UPI002E11A99C|nr:hypothetical protein OG430_24125 [Streptomyces sp. NBC_01304]
MHQPNFLRRWAAPVLIALVLTGFHSVTQGGGGFSNDSYRYTRASLQLLGMERAEAQLAARDAYCDAQPAPNRAACLKANPHGLLPDHPRYERIFDTRPGYPLLAAPFIAAFGVLKGLWLLSLALTTTLGVLVYRLLRIAGTPRYAALAGQVVALMGGLGYWGARHLADTLVAPCVVACAIGAVHVLEGRRRAGWTWLVAGLAAVGLAKYSTAMLLTVCLAAVAGAYAWRVRHQVTLYRRALALLGGSAGAALVVNVTTAALGLPGLSESMQDTLTRYFTRPDVPDPVRGMLALEAGYWPSWLHLNAGFAVLLAVCCFALWRGRPVLAVPGIAVGLTGIGTAVAHPLLEELDRLWVLAWLPVALGVPLLVETVRGWGVAVVPPARRGERESGQVAAQSAELGQP